MNYFVAENSIIEEEVIIGDGTKVWYYSHIRNNAKIGRDCVIGDHVYIGEKAVLGNNVKVGNKTDICNGVVIKDNVRIGWGTKFTNVVKPSPIKKSPYRDILVGENVSIGANVTIVAGVRIGNGAIIADGTIVIRDVLDNKWVGGNPARVLGKADKQTL